MEIRSLTIPLLILATLSAGCRMSGAGPGDSVSTVTDSAGVRIVQSEAPSGEAAGWRVASEPRVSIGSANGEDGQALLHRVFSVRTLATGEILVSNSSSSQVIAFDSTGVELYSFGGLGEGPGEFMKYAPMFLLSVAGDSVAVADRFRINIFRRSGEIVRSIMPTQVEGFGAMSVSAAFSDGSWLGYMPVGTGLVSSSTPGERLDEAFGFIRYSRDGHSATPFATVRARPEIVIDIGNGGVSYFDVPLTPGAIFAVDGTSLLLNIEGKPELLRLSPDSTVQAVYRWRTARVAVDEIWGRYTSSVLHDVSKDRRTGYMNLFATPDLPLPAFVPTMETMLVDSDRCIWVGRYRLPWDEDRTWDIFDSDGFWLGQLITPRGLVVHQIGADFILGVHRDSLGVERVQTYDLFR